MPSVDMHIDTLTNPLSWFEYCRQQKLIGDVLLEKATSDEEILKIKNYDSSTCFTTFIINAHYHWGIAIENGLKGLYVKYHCDEITYTKEGDNIIIKNVGGHAGKTHNLLRLAESLGIFDKPSNDLHKFSSDYEALKQVLLHLGDVIKWAARYPISHNTASVFRLSGETPPILIYGFHILDVMNPLFELFEKELRNFKIITKHPTNEGNHS